MKIAFFSSVLNHHQIEFCDAMYELYGDDFTFVATMEIEKQRVDLGYSLFERSYTLKMHVSENNRHRAEQLFQEADVVILGVFLQEWLRRRLRAGRLTFLHKERLFKEKPSVYWWLRCLLFVMREYYPHRRKPFYMMAASAYSLPDYQSLGFFKHKTFQWGYFPPNKVYDLDELLDKKRETIPRLLWVGRTLEWKHPLYALQVATELKKQGIPFHLDMIGCGPLDEEIKATVAMNGLSEQVTLHGSMPPNTVREYMERATCYLFTSDRGEGFGAVATEALNSACVVIASETAGATNLLIEHGKNGYVYRKDSVEDLLRWTVEAVTHDHTTMMREAYNSICDVNNAREAAKRFSAVIEAMVKKEPLPDYQSGPMKRL